MKTVAVVILITLGLTGCSTTKLRTAEPSHREHLTKQPKTSYEKVKPDVSYPFPYNRHMTHLHMWRGPEYAAPPSDEPPAGYFDIVSPCYWCYGCKPKTVIGDLTISS